MARETERDYTISYIYTVVTAIMARIGKHELDFSEPYIFNCLPNIREGLCLNKIFEEGGVLSFEGVTDDGTAYTISQSDIDDCHLKEIAGLFIDSDNYKYIEDYFIGN